MSTFELVFSVVGFFILVFFLVLGIDLASETRRKRELYEEIREARRYLQMEQLLMEYEHLAEHRRNNDQ